MSTTLYQNDGMYVTKFSGGLEGMKLQISTEMDNYIQVTHKQLILLMPTLCDWAGAPWNNVLSLQRTVDEAIKVTEAYRVVVEDQQGLMDNLQGQIADLKRDMRRAAAKIRQGISLEKVEGCPLNIAEEVADQLAAIGHWKP